MIHHVGEQDVRRLLSMADAIAVVDRAMRARAEGRAFDVPRHVTAYPDGSLRVLSASAPELGLLGYKSTFSAPDGPARGYLYLVDLRTGDLRAVIESVHLSVLRTGAASGVATRCLARQDARCVAMIGTGTQAMGQLEATVAVRPIDEVRVWSRTTEHARDFALRAGRELGIPAVAVPAVHEAVRGADIVNVITRSDVPVLLGEWLEPGQHINAAGSNARNRRELDEYAIERCRSVVVDARDVAERECGDLLPLVERGTLSWRSLPELGELLTAEAPGRSARDDITLYESHGLGVQDLYAGQFVLEAVQGVLR
jgi:ornithine cyclodeaminase